MNKLEWEISPGPGRKTYTSPGKWKNIIICILNLNGKDSWTIIINRQSNHYNMGNCLVFGGLGEPPSFEECLEKRKKFLTEGK
jgi:hypothetical protein